jgi:hypothetical protein
MKTAMEELLNDTFKGDLKELSYYIELEKKQIIKAVIEGTNWQNSNFKNALDYYEQNYKK